MKILVVGTGAREHAICNAVKDAELYSIMSNRNPGISRISKFQISSEKDLIGVKKYALDNKIDIAIIGPEAPLEMGIVDELQAAGIGCVGPTKEAARIETDKAFMRDLFDTHKIGGSIVYKVFDSVEDTGDFIDEFGQDVVVKPVGLTGGKGVKIVGEHLEDGEAAKRYVKEIIENKISGYAQVVIEERLIGEEFTVQAFVDGDKVVPMPAAQDHPHAYEGDQGPITGGMGSYSDKDGLLPFLDRKNYQESVKIMQDTVNAIKKEVGPYKGILYGQFMLCKDGPKLVEYNARFGDPEAMNVLPLLKTDFVELCENIVDGNLKSADFKRKATVCKYMVPQGYPETGKAGQIINVNESKINQEGALVYYAAVNQKDDKIFTSASRALGLVGIGNTISEAEEICENVTKYVKGEVYHRRDVGTAKLIEKRIKHMNMLRS
ncbi:phosphoribosylamine--glycine ligase [Methanobacterium spitsbergense]|uniref:Phosphoribosylamine--glycine ligase n=1 Tax=Methanobacterium spitsbergense TaxID=2874285 RepID=A0A8T5UN36_9EURY|nr:phosphoribosylamine--glycine ligase [Methanobacterium spitsbergense]MBZ2165074.1 phosphoribosylamine--glycine ligase [Methanobacterium spitsbergense]